MTRMSSAAGAQGSAPSPQQPHTQGKPQQPAPPQQPQQPPPTKPGQVKLL